MHFHLSQLAHRDPFGMTPMSRQAWHAVHLAMASSHVCRLALRACTQLLLLDRATCIGVLDGNYAAAPAGGSPVVCSAADLQCEPVRDHCHLQHHLGIHLIPLHLWPVVPAAPGGICHQQAAVHCSGNWR